MDETDYYALAGKWNNTLCPVCGRWMKVELAEREARMIKIWYCTNPGHDYTAI